MLQVRSADLKIASGHTTDTLTLRTSRSYRAPGKNLTVKKLSLLATKSILLTDTPRARHYRFKKRYFTFLIFVSFKNSGATNEFNETKQPA